MQKEYFFSKSPKHKVWDEMWIKRTIEQELEACEMESPPRNLFLTLISKDSKIIDAGCGFGKWVIYLRQNGYDIIGIDNSEQAISKLKDYDKSIKIEIGDVLNINYPDNSFDVYISMGVIEHFEDGPIPALKEAFRVLKPNGLIFVSVPTVNIIRKVIRRSLRNFINLIPKIIINTKSVLNKSKDKLYLREKVNILTLRRGRYYHFIEYRYSRTQLENYLKQSNFKVIKTVPHDFFDSKEHSIGLVVDFPFLGLYNEANFKLNSLGKFISHILDKLSPWFACSSILCVGKALKQPSK